MEDLVAGSASGDEQEGTGVPSPPTILELDEDGTEAQEVEPAQIYVPLRPNLQDEIFDRINRETRLKNEIKLVDKEYRNMKVDPLRAELYKDLIRYFKITPIEKMRVLLRQVSDKSFSRFIRPDPDLKKFKSLDKKKKIQKLVNYLCTQSTEETREMLYSTAGRMALLWIGKANQKEFWTAFRLLKPRKSYPVDMEFLPFVQAVADSLEEKLHEIESRNYSEGQTNTCYYIHCRISAGIGYVGLRIQTVPGKRRRKDRETSKNIIFAIKQNLPHFFVHGKEANPDEDILVLFTSCMRYKHYEVQNLSSKDLALMIESCTRRLVVPSVEEFMNKFDEEEKVMNARGVFYADRAGAQRTQYQCAMIQDGQAGGVSTYTLRNKIKVPRSSHDGPGESRKYSNMETTIKLGKGLNLDDYVIDLYKRGIITDLKAFMKMKATGSNIYVESDEEEAVAVDEN